MATEVTTHWYFFLGKDYRFLKLVFTVLASCLIIDLFYSYFVLKPTYTSNEKRKMSVEDFPEIILCPQPSFDLNAVESRGYKGQMNYFFGSNDLGVKQIGWAGNNKSEDAKKVFEEISIMKSISQCPDGNETIFWFGRRDVAVEMIKFELTKTLTPYNRCCKVISSNISDIYPYSAHFVWPADGSPKVFKVFLTDKLTSSYFDLHKTIMLGDTINSFTATGVTGSKTYKIKIMEDQKLEDDPNYPCIDYKTIGEYSKCVENEMIRQNMKFLNCTPPWMTDNEDLWCKREYEVDSEMIGIEYINFLGSISISEADTGECLVPCKSKRYQAKEVGFTGSNNLTGIVLKFERDVDITKSSWTINFKTLLSKIGGFIGLSKNFLWLVILFISSVGALMSHLKLNYDPK